MGGHEGGQGRGAAAALYGRMEEETAMDQQLRRCCRGEVESRDRGLVWRPRAVAHGDAEGRQWCLNRMRKGQPRGDAAAVEETVLRTTTRPVGVVVVTVVAPCAA
ncbi:hypothetical protein SESBI_07726 [Sesbania bispinosa]|nr:hypothetical protein SESBI_07726 [Sesbania bispinosa]